MVRTASTGDRSVNNKQRRKHSRKRSKMSQIDCSYNEGNGTGVNESKRSKRSHNRRHSHNNVKPNEAKTPYFGPNESLIQG